MAGKGERLNKGVVSVVVAKENDLLELEPEADAWVSTDTGSLRYPSQVRRDLMHRLQEGFCSSHLIWRFLILLPFITLKDHKESS
jgi:hypothetical protein